MAREERDGKIYINGLPMDEFRDNCAKLHKQRGLAVVEPSKDTKRKKSKTVWELAFCDIEKCYDYEYSLFIPSECDAKVFPCSDKEFGHITFEGYLAAIMTVGAEYSICDITYMLSCMFDTTPNGREMLENTLCKLLAWGLIEYVDGYKLLRRTNLVLRGLVNIDEVGGWKQLELYSPEGELMRTYNTEGTVPTYVVKGWCAPTPPSERVTSISLNVLNPEEPFPEFSETMTFGEAVSALMQAAKVSWRRYYRSKRGY